MTTRTQKAIKQLSQASTNLQVAAGIDNGHHGLETIADPKWLIGRLAWKLSLFLDGGGYGDIGENLRELADVIQAQPSKKIELSFGQYADSDD
tara:strand:+ start:143 stop:421 length:279 start_codon:yes stop_codon:yes gene_type:complete